MAAARPGFSSQVTSFTELGLAAPLLRALEEGASAAWLQVESDNTGARALYEGMGFGTHHSYHHYRRAAV